MMKKDMKRAFLAFALLGTAACLWGQQQRPDYNRNYCSETVVRRSGIFDALRADSLGVGEGIRTIRYYDGFGFPLQEVVAGASAGGSKDLIRHQEHDEHWRESRVYLPYAAGGGVLGGFRTDAKPETANYHASAYPYAETVYEPSLLDRVLEQGAAGETWQPGTARTATGGRTIVTEYGTNGTASFESVRLWNVADGGITCSSVYPSGVLLRTTVKDENWLSEDGKRGTTDTYTDRDGRVVLTRSWVARGDSLAPLDTYHVYDDLGRLRYVLPPSLNEGLQIGSTPLSDSDPRMEKYAYIFRYDGNGNCISKKLPGCESVEMRYDPSRRLVLRRDGIQRRKGEWTFYLYDALGRQAVQGICTLADTEKITGRRIVASFTGNGHYGGYDASLSADASRLLSVNYYDGYGFADNDTALRYKGQTGYDTPRITGGTPDGRGLLTGTAVYSADGSSDSPCVTAFYYNDRGKVVQSRSRNHLGGTEEDFFSYSFTDLPEHQLHVHTVPGSPSRQETYRYTYDNMDRLLTVHHSVDALPETLIVDNEYDELGRLKSKMGTGYSYNIRDWVTSIDHPHFHQSLHYTDGTGTPCYNGNISSMTWNTGAGEKGYRFAYDGLNRLTKADYDGTGDYSTAYSYDPMGNLLNLQRYGPVSASDYGLIDNLNLAYSGNQLQSVRDNATHAAYGNGTDFKDGANAEVEYEYDANGNLVKDLNKKIADIQYNCLNLPSRIQFENGNTISYVYSVDGTKLRTTHVMGNDTTVTDYCGNVIYEDGTAKTLLVDGGYVSLSDGKYHFYIQDHQGNNRVVVDEDGTVEEVNDYYPFGGLMASSSASVQPYKYNGKELDRKNGLDWYDYGARHYDAALGRFMTQDRFAEKYVSLSPYQYGANNPINNIDVNGDSIRVYVETQKFGHSWMSVGEGENMVVYSYGRFNGTYKGEKGSHFFNIAGNGDGVLLRLTGEQAKEYMSEKESLGMSSFVISDLKDLEVSRMLDDIFYSSNKMPDNFKSDYYNDPAAHIIDGYDLLKNNCTTFVSDILNRSGSSALKNERIEPSRFGPMSYFVNERFIVPASFKNYLNSISRVGQNVYKTR